MSTWTSLKAQTNFSKLLTKWLEILILFAKWKNLLKSWLNVEIGFIDITIITSLLLVKQTAENVNKTKTF